MATEVLGGGNVEPRALEDEMRSAYLDYAMSVIVGRALPDVRDGLKPVHRRVLFAMSELGLGPTRGYSKSSRIVGEVMGNYHPHGDASIYDTLVRLAQDFSMRYPLIDGQGNFGSVDDDPPAAMRYTEARLERLALEMLRDLDMDTVDFAPNYDGRKQEPIVLPARSQGLFLVQRIRDEAHRFAVTYHQQLRGKRAVRSVLDEIQGVGPAKKRALLRTFGSVKGMREATEADLAGVAGVGPALAERIKQAID